jgi:hypothetical protein
MSQKLVGNNMPCFCRSAATNQSQTATSLKQIAGKNILNGNGKSASPLRSIEDVRL